MNEKELIVEGFDDGRGLVFHSFLGKKNYFGIYLFWNKKQKG